MRMRRRVVLLASAYLHEGEVANAKKTLRESIETPSLTV